MLDNSFYFVNLNGMYYSPYPKTKLFIDMVPFNAWGQNLRNKLFISEAEWDRLRRETYRRADSRCEVCKGKGEKHPVECHEQWHFDAQTQVQTLRGLVALCPACHAATHFGFWTQQEPTTADTQLRNHLAKVNGWTPAKVEKHIEAAYAACQRLNSVQWLLDLTILERDYPDLLTPHTHRLMAAMHAGKHFDAQRPLNDVAQPKRRAPTVPSRVPRTRDPFPWPQDWLAGKHCADTLQILMGGSTLDEEVRARLPSRLAEGMPMDHLRQLGVDLVLKPLVAAHAGDAERFFDALDHSPLMPLAKRDTSGAWCLAYGFKPERHWGVDPSNWVQYPTSKELQWDRVAQAIGLDKKSSFGEKWHEARFQAWSERYAEVYDGLLLRLYEIDVDD